MAEKEKKLTSMIGEALVKDGKLTAERLERAIRVQRFLEQPKQLGEVLIDLGYATKQTIKEAISKHGIRLISVESTGLVSMREDGIAKVIRGVTTFDEVLRHTPRTFECRPLRQIMHLTQ